MSKREAIIARIREHYAEQGISLDALSDRDVEIGVRQLAEATREAGTSPEAATEAMRRAVAIAEQQAKDRAADEAAALEEAIIDQAEAGDAADGVEADPPEAPAAADAAPEPS